MKINLPVKILIGVLTAWVFVAPLIYFGVWFVFLLPVFTSGSTSQPTIDYIPTIFFPLFFIVICSSFLQIGLQAFYIVHVILNKLGGDVLRSVFGVGFFILPSIAMLVYYLIYIVPANPPHWALASNPPGSNTAVISPPPSNP